MQFLLLALFQGNAEALVRWGGKIKHILIAYFLSNILPNIIKINSCLSKLRQAMCVNFFGDNEAEKKEPIFFCVRLF